VALSDPQGLFARPLMIIERSDEEADVRAIIDIIVKHEVKQIVAGLPRLMDGSLSTQAAKVEAFVQSLRLHTAVPIELRDERLTTVSAQRLMREASTKKTKSKRRDDAVAAAIILQSYLDESIG